MGIQRASVLYPENSITVDTGTGIDIRILADSQPGADEDQTVQATHTQDNQHRTFDPGSTGITANDDPLTLQNLGWALRVVDDMTPTDDTNCDAILLSGTATTNIRVAVDQSGGTYVAGSHGPTFEVSWWEYDPVANTGSLIQSATSSSTTWNYTPVTGDLGTFKTVAISTNIASDHEFTEGSILLLQIGLNVGTIPNPTLGTATWTYTLRTDNTNTNITFAASQGIRQACVFSNSVTGVGIASRPTLAAAMTRTTTGVGTPTFTKAVTASKTFAITGIGTADHTKAVDLDTFTLTGVGTVDGTITIPIDEVPTGGGGGITVNPIFAVMD